MKRDEVSPEDVFTFMKFIDKLMREEKYSQEHDKLLGLSFSQVSEVYATLKSLGLQDLLV